MKDPLDVELVFDRYLGDSAVLDQLQALLATHAPRWFQGIHIWKQRGDEIPIPNDPSALHRAIVPAATERGPTYQALVARYGSGDERMQGTAELRGKNAELIVVVTIDQKPFARIGGRLLLGNHISFQVRKPHVEHRPAQQWVLAIMRDACAVMSPAWAAAYTSDEYLAKVMEDGFAAGRDFSRFLPGLFWLNFFGSPYLDAIGIQQLDAIRAYDKAPVDSGFLIQLHRDPTAWTTPEYKTAEEDCRQSIGTDFFFSKTGPSTTSRAPQFPVGR